jgi:hypothetical protein
MININEVKKDLYKTKANAVFSRYVAGNLYYKIVFMGDNYEFPISTIENYCKVSNLIDEPEGDESMDGNFYVLSSDLGTTEFSSEMKGSELNRWIQKAVEKNEFIKIS